MWDKILLISTNTYLKVDNMPTIGFEIKRKCKVCGKVFVAKTLDSHYCSPKCGKVAWKRKKDAKDKSARLEAIARQIERIALKSQMVRILDLITPIVDKSLIIQQR